ncbi:MAG: hypothetical protein ACPLTR_03860 [Thermacetogeniaceae bacterium]
MMEEEVKELLARKLLEGRMTKEEWEALEIADREKAVAEALAEAVRIEDASAPAGNRLPAGLLFQDIPPDVAGVTLPPRYTVGPEGVYYAGIREENGQVKAHVTRLTRTPFLIAARDAGSGRVKLLVRLQGEWRGEWVQASRLTAAKLADWFIFPERGIKEKELVAYARACAAVAPFMVADDYLARTAVEILCRLFPVAGAGVEFPALRAFADVREMAMEMGIDPLAVRRYWQKQGLILEGAGKVVRQGAGTARMLIFTEKVKKFLQELPKEFLNAQAV